MIRLKQHPVFCGSAALVATLLAVESWWLHAVRRAEALAWATLAQKQQEWHVLTAREPIPAELQAADTAAILGRAEDELAVLEESLGRLGFTAEVFREEASAQPASRLEAFFDLAGFCRRWQEKAGGAGVKISAEEAFGFSDYVHAGPDPGVIPVIHRQRLMVERLLEALLASSPSELVAVQRERPRGHAAAGGPAPGDKGKGEPDLLTFEPRLSLREPGVIETTGLRLAFLGRTAALRCFLNQLAQEEVPLVVRSVEVEPVRGPPERATGLSGGTEPLAVLVRPVLSRFTVTVEFCELRGITARAAATAAVAPEAGEPAPAVHLWAEPGPQRRGHGWLYDVFTPPSVYYDRKAGRLSATPAAGVTGGGTTEPRLDLELLEIRPGLFRLQLVGFAGGTENLRGIFLDPGTGETVIGHPGESLAGRGLTVKSIGLDRGPVGSVASAETRGIAVTAVVVDEGTGIEVVLTSREPCREGAPLGLFASRKTPDFRRELQAGESVALDGMNYCVERIEPETQSAVVVCLPPGGREPLVRTLPAQRTPVEKPAEDTPRGG
ncbi:MAG: Amuc_1100 family pilus-like protein [Opitutaceae bacterium]|nr:Amuc_1100 family pilus-like protein [Opitutaceae bacterium]